ncbi:hypothetical protein MMC29_006850 [Sticta canariensis]|nr:hypothetical protein [Sticta canariensis]
MAKSYIPLYQESGYGLFPTDDGGNFEASFRPYRKKLDHSLADHDVCDLSTYMVEPSSGKVCVKKIFTSPKAPSSYAKPVELPITYKHFWWNTDYSSVNDTLQDKLWDDILPSHGIVAIDRDEAAENNYPESMYHPANNSKGVYLLESYQLHLPQGIRESLANVDFTWKAGARTLSIALTISSKFVPPLESYTLQRCVQGS